MPTPSPPLPQKEVQRSRSPRFAAAVILFHFTAAVILFHFSAEVLSTTHVNFSLRAVREVNMPPTAKTKSSKTKWADAQFVLDDDGLPLPRGTRAIEILSTEQAGCKRGRSTEPLGGPEFCGPVEDRSGVAFTASDESRGGAAALRHWREARCQVDWVAVGEQHCGPQCESCLKGGHASCDEHRIEPPEAPRRWWHGPNRDQGLEEISDRAAAKEASQQVSSTGLAGSWRCEWPALRREQLRLQGQGYLTSDERMAPGRPDSIEWMVQDYKPQISFMVRDGWEPWVAEAYTLLACCATAALGRAAREGGTDYPCCARVLREALHERSSHSTAPAPAAYTNLTGQLSLCSADPAWARLCERGGAPPEVGIEIVTSAVAVAVASAECFQSAQGFAASLSRGGVTELLAVESDVVCFESRGPATEGGQPRSLVPVGGSGYHLPPGARLRLVSVQQRFKAYGTSVRRRLFTVTIEGFDEAPAEAAAAAAAASEPREAQAAGPSCALATPAPMHSLGRPSAAASLLAVAPKLAEDLLSVDDVASGSGFAESGGEDGDDASNDGGGACARVPAAPGGAARLHGDGAL